MRNRTGFGIISGAWIRSAAHPFSTTKGDSMKPPKLLIVIVLSLIVTGTIHAEKCTEPGSITKVKNRSVGQVEYVIFDIRKAPDGSLPEFEVDTAAPPFTDYSGEETYQVAGGKHKKIVFRSVNWLCDIPERYRLPKTAVKGIKLLWSFEGIVEFAVGYSSRSKYLATYSYDAGSVTKVVMKFRK